MEEKSCTIDDKKNNDIKQVITDRYNKKGNKFEKNERFWFGIKGW